MRTSDNVLLELSAESAVAAMRRGEMTAEDYATALLNRAEQLAHLNAFRTLDRSMVLEAARGADLLRAAAKPLGALHGLPIPVKDSVNTQALPTSGGTRALEKFRPNDNAAVLKPLFAQGALLMGKTNLHELSYGWTCNNLSFGPVRNPYDPERIPGGSSGGSAVAVAGRMAPLAVAEDTHGSIRVPASMCGLAGLRPTYGRYPGEGTLPITQDKFDQPGALARTASDLALFDAVVTGDMRPIMPAPLAGIRLGIAPEFFFEGMDVDVERIVAAALEKLEAAGATIVRAELPESLTVVPALALTIGAYELLASLSGFLSQQGAGVTCEDVLAQVGANTDAAFRSVALPPNAVPADSYRNALRLREELMATALSYFRENDVDAIVFPPVLCPPPALGDNAEIEINGQMVSILKAIGRNTALGPFFRMPGLVLPASMTTSGLPVGIEFEALPGRDRNLLALGLSVEGVLGRLLAPKVLPG